MKNRGKQTEQRGRASRALRAALSFAVCAASLTATSSGPAAAAPDTWRLEPTVSVSSFDHRLDDVACPTTTMCMAVGSYDNGAGALQTLTQTRIAGTWSVISSPNVANTSNTLSGVTCLSETFCVAVGSFSVPSGFATLIEIWNGTTWTISSSPNLAGAESSGLNDVSCATTSSCVAVGVSRFNAGTSSKTLALHFDGTSWVVKTTPNPSTLALPSNWLGGVSCINPTACTAVGSYQDPTFTRHPLILTWTGTAWFQISTPTLPAGVSPVDISCVSSTFCMGVGDYQGHAQAFVRNGPTWALSTMPNQGSGGYPSPRAVTCLSSSQCVAVGGFGEFLEVWDGTAWSIGATQSLGLEITLQLNGVACDATGACVAVGARQDPSVRTPWIGTAFTGRISGNARIVTVSWSDVEYSRLHEVALYLGQTHVEVHKTAVYLVSFLLSFGPSTPTPTVLPQPGTAKTFSITFDANEINLLDAVKAKFVLNDSDATRLSVQLLEYLLALGGH